MDPATIVKLLQLWNVGAWEGDYMPRTGSFIVRVPSSLHEELGGNFSTEELKAIAERHAAAGVYPLLHFVAVNPIIISIADVGSGNITISWDHHQTGTTYEIYGTTKNPLAYSSVPWTLISSGISEGANTSTFAAIETGTTNYIWVKATDPDGNNTPSDSLDVVKYASIHVDIP